MLTKKTTLLARIILAIALLVVVYLCVRTPAYDFSVWIPNSLLIFLKTPKEIIFLLNDNEDKLAHIVFGFFIAVLVTLSLPLNAQNKNRKKLCILAFLFLILCLSAEVLQLQIGRTFSYSDAIIGFISCLAGLMMTNAWLNHKAH